MNPPIHLTDQDVAPPPARATRRGRQRLAGLDDVLGEEMAGHDDQVGDRGAIPVITHGEQAGIVTRRQPRGHRAEGTIRDRLAQSAVCLALSSNSSVQASHTKSPTGELFGKARNRSAPQAGQNMCAATQPSLSARTFWVGPLKTACSSAKPSWLQRWSSCPI